MRMRKLVGFILLSVGLVGCNSMQSMVQSEDPFTGEQKINNTAKGAGVGALSGAIIGAMNGDRKTALMGAVVGAVAGGGVGHYMDDQETKMREKMKGTGVSVARKGDTLVLNMPAGIFFNSGQAYLKEDGLRTVYGISEVANEFDDTILVIKGHADSSGNSAANDKLSFERASWVENLLIASGVNSNRLSASGAGDREPVASNATPAGRAANRRVEITLKGNQS